MTFVIAFLLGSMFGACVGFLTAGVLRAINDEAAPAADRRYLRTGHADFPHPALGQDFTPSPTARRAQARLGVEIIAERGRPKSMAPCRWYHGP